jgi:hypothetical protein
MPQQGSEPVWRGRPRGRLLRALRRPQSLQLLTDLVLLGRTCGGRRNRFRDPGGDIEFVARCPQLYRCSQLPSIGGRRRPGLRGLSRNAGEGGPAPPELLFLQRGALRVGDA